MSRPKSRAGRPCGDDVMKSSKDLHKAPLRSCQHLITEVRSDVKEGHLVKEDPGTMTVGLGHRSSQKLIKQCACGH
jgi:hypothetical protein